MLSVPHSLVDHTWQSKHISATPQRHCNNMADFFAAIYQGVKTPDVIMNSGPLPPMNPSGPAGFNGTPDGKINYNTTLLGDMDPYAYAGPGRLSTQTAYLNIPHVVQRVIPQINLPEAQCGTHGGGFMSLTHQVQEGDIAFVIRAMFSPYEIVSDKGRYARQGMLYAIDPIVNLATLNYLLHGLQRYGYKPSEKNWNTLWIALGLEVHFKNFKQHESLSKTMKGLNDTIDSMVVCDQASCVEMKQCRHTLAKHIIKHVITPFGVPRGSDKQGGQHQGVVNKAVTWPVDFVTAMVIDGKVINLMNFWKHDELNAGDDLMLYLSDSPSTNYVLSHHAKSMQTQNFRGLSKWGEKMECIYQLTPGVSSSNSKEVRAAVWRHGYWHIARSQVMQFKHDTYRNLCCHANAAGNDKPLEATFAPVWTDCIEEPFAWFDEAIQINANAGGGSSNASETDGDEADTNNSYSKRNSNSRGGAKETAGYTKKAEQRHEEETLRQEKDKDRKAKEAEQKKVKEDATREAAKAKIEEEEKKTAAAKQKKAKEAAEKAKEDTDKAAVKEAAATKQEKEEAAEKAKEDAKKAAVKEAAVTKQQQKEKDAKKAKEDAKNKAANEKLEEENKKTAALKKKKEEGDAKETEEEAEEEIVAEEAKEEGDAKEKNGESATEADAQEATDEAAPAAPAAAASAAPAAAASAAPAAGAGSDADEAQEAGAGSHSAEFNAYITNTIKNQPRIVGITELGFTEPGVMTQGSSELTSQIKIAIVAAILKYLRQMNTPMGPVDDAECFADAISLYRDGVYATDELSCESFIQECLHRYMNNTADIDTERLNKETFIFKVAVLMYTAICAHTAVEIHKLFEPGENDSEHLKNHQLAIILMRNAAIIAFKTFIECGSSHKLPLPHILSSFEIDTNTVNIHKDVKKVVAQYMSVYMYCINTMAKEAKILDIDPYPNTLWPVNMPESIVNVSLNNAWQNTNTHGVFSKIRQEWKHQFQSKKESFEDIASQVEKAFYTEDTGKFLTGLPFHPDGAQLGDEFQPFQVFSNGDDYETSSESSATTATALRQQLITTVQGTVKKTGRKRMHSSVGKGGSEIATQGGGI